MLAFGAIKPFKVASHLAGGFNEDVETGIVYTGIPGYGMCSISPDLKTWSKLGSDERLKGNIHGIVVFKHKGETYIAVAQNEDSRVLVVGLDGTVLQQLDIPTGGEFNFDAANGACTLTSLKAFSAPSLPLEVTSLPPQPTIRTARARPERHQTSHVSPGVYCAFER